MRVCAVMPAAGRGSRLNLSHPKLLASITDHDTVWSLLRRRLEGLVDHIHVVLSPRDRDVFQRVLDHEAEQKAGHESEQTPHVPRVSIGIQEEPTGMGDAVFCGHAVWSQADVVLLLWADQVHVSRDTFQAGLRLHRHAPQRIVLPLVSLPLPYVEYVFNAAGHLTAVRESREGDRCQPGGLGDVGTFILSTDGLGEEWMRYRAACGPGAITAEINFLPFLVHLARRCWEVIPLHVSEPLQARGVNTSTDLEFFRTLYSSGVPGVPT
jgi:bifunctional UDP-N-acetylglucosamine pyrophosphorylase / glucosamine-1-phosphate N-acetyltransferase